MRLQTEPSLAMSSQHWHTFLSMDLSVPITGSTKSAKQRQNVLDMVVPKSTIYPEVQTRSTTKQLLVWQGKEYPLRVLPPEDVVWQVLWELYKLNFIHELQLLDRHTCGELDLSDTARLIKWEMKILKCFPINSFRCRNPIRKLWIGSWWIGWMLQVCCPTTSCHEVLERRETCNFWYVNG